MGYFDQINARMAEMKAKKKKQADTNEMKVGTRKKQTRENLSAVLARNTNESGCTAVAPAYKTKDTPPTKSSSAAEFLQAKAGDLLASARKWAGNVSEQAKSNSKKNTAGRQYTARRKY